MTTELKGTEVSGWKLPLVGLQMLFVAFGALVLMPLITGLDPSVALFTAGAGTLLFQLVTKRSIPVFLASSFVFIAPISISISQFGQAATMGALMAAGGVYMLLAAIVAWRGPDIIHRLLPPVVTGPVIMIIGLNLAPVAVGNAMGMAGDTRVFPYVDSMIVATIALSTTVAVSVFAGGIFRLVPILAGVIVGYIAAFLFGMVDLAPVAAQPLFAVPNFTAPEFNLAAILFMLPVAIAPAIEHVGDVLAISNVTGKNYLKKPGLHRTLFGDGVATALAAAFGGPPNTTYSEVTGAVTLTRAFNPVVMTWAAVFAIGLAFIAKFGILLQTIPVPVMGGIMILLFGSIASVGMNILIKNHVDLSIQRNLVIVATTLVLGLGGMVVGNDSFSLQGISLCGIVAIVLNLILPKGAKTDSPAP